MGVLSGLLRRLLGGLKTKFKIFGERGFLIACLVLLYSPTIYFSHYHTWIEGIMPKWIFTIMATALVIICELKGHFPGFKCGSESLKYINEEIAKGRKIPYRKIVSWVGRKRGFSEFGKEWCLYQLILCKTVWAIPVAICVGSQFWFAGLCTAFAYNAMYWVDMRPIKNILKTPTNWGEFWQGCFYMWALWGV